MTLEGFDQPLLASDGHTYSAGALAAAMAADPWHKSPITGEILRACAYPNTFVAQYVDCAPGKLTTLFDECTPATVRQVPPNGELRVVGLPVAVDAARALVRAQWGLPADASTTLTVRLLRTPAGMALMHPPCPNNFQEQVRALANLFGLCECVTNPWCLSTAVLESLPGVPAQTVDAYLLTLKG